MRTRSGRRQRGFTLVELMTVIAIIGVLTTMAVITLRSSSYAKTPMGFAEAIAAELEVSRLRAVTKSRWQKIEITASGIDHWEADTQGMATPTNVLFVSRVQAPRDVEINAVADSANDTTGGHPGDGTFERTEIWIAPDGGTESSTFYIQDTSEARRTRVALFGVTGMSYAFSEW